MSFSELVVVFLAVLLLFGSKKIPEVARIIAKFLKEAKQVTSEIQKEIDQANFTKDIKEIKKTIPENPLSKEIEDIENKLLG